VTLLASWIYYRGEPKVWFASINLNIHDGFLLLLSYNTIISYIKMCTLSTLRERICGSTEVRMNPAVCIMTVNVVYFGQCVQITSRKIINIVKYTLRYNNNNNKAFI